jgi:hypothetical protein
VSLSNHESNVGRVFRPAENIAQGQRGAPKGTPCI